MPCLPAPPGPPDGNAGDQPSALNPLDVTARRVPQAERPIRVLIADDHEFVRRGVRSLLSDVAGGRFEVCGEATNGREAVAKARELRPDVVVIDVSMPELNGLEATRRIHKEVPHAELVILTIHESEQLLFELLKAGARGYLLKSDLARDLPAAVESAYRHRPVFTSHAARQVLEGYLKQAARAGTPSPLTPSERQIVQLLAEGKSNKEVADHQGISVKTAEAHRAHIMHKLGLGTISDLVHYAVRNGIIEP